MGVLRRAEPAGFRLLETGFRGRQIGRVGLAVVSQVHRPVEGRFEKTDVSRAGSPADAVGRAVRSPGAGARLQPAVRGRIEGLLGISLERVRVHTDADAQRAARRIGNEPELEFIDHVPTVWDDTKVLAGELGKCSLIARRSGTDWFIGAMNADAPQDFSVPLMFLEAGKKYTAHRYSHDPSVPTRTKVKIETQPVTRETTLNISLAVRSGEAIRIVLDK